jgi:hypothetical protein
MAKTSVAPKLAKRLQLLPSAGWAWMYIISVEYSRFRTRRFNRALIRWRLYENAEAWADLVEAALVIAKRERNKFRRSIGMKAVA